MSNNPYDDYLDAPSSAPSPGPQPVTGPENPFRAQAPSLGADLGGYGAPHHNPFLPSADSPVPYGQPVRYGYNAPSPELQRHLGTMRLNAWASAFIPIVSVFFFLFDKGKQSLYDDHLRETLNMGLTRLILVGGVAFFDGFLGAAFSLAALVYFVLAILGAMEAPKRYMMGQKYQYKGAIPFTRK